MSIGSFLMCADMFSHLFSPIWWRKKWKGAVQCVKRMELECLWRDSKLLRAGRESCAQASWWWHLRAVFSCVRLLAISRLLLRDLPEHAHFLDAFQQKGQACEHGVWTTVSIENRKGTGVGIIFWFQQLMKQKRLLCCALLWRTSVEWWPARELMPKCCIAEQQRHRSSPPFFASSTHAKRLGDHADPRIMLTLGIRHGPSD